MNSSAISSGALPGALPQLRLALAADVLKLKRTAALWLTLGSGALPAALTFLIFFFKGDKLLKPDQNPWAAYVLQSWQTAAGLLLPLFVVLLTSLLLHVENKGSAWKHLYAQPVPRLSLWISKLLVLLGLNLLAQLLYLGALLLSGLLLGLLRPELHFQTYAVPFVPAATLLMHTFVATLGLLALQYIASLWWRSFVLPVALGMGSTIVGLTLMRWEHINWVPYAAPLLSVGNAQEQAGRLVVTGPLAESEWLALGWFGVVLLVGFWALRYRREQ